MGELLYLPHVSRDHAPRSGEGPAVGKSASKPTARRKAGMGGEDGTLYTYVQRYTCWRIDSGEVTGETPHTQRLTLVSFSASFGRRSVDKLGESDVVRWLGTIRHQAPTTRRKKFSEVRTFTAWLVRQRIILRDPCANLKAPRVPRGVPKVFEPDEVEALFEYAPDARATLILSLGFDLGLRVGEMAGLELGDVGARGVVVRGKGGHQRVLPLLPEVRSALDGYLRVRGGAAGPLLQNYHRPGHGLSAHTISQLWRQWVRDAEVKRHANDGLSAHGARRSCFTAMVDEGAGSWQRCSLLSP